MEKALIELEAEDRQTRLRGVRRLSATGGAEAVTVLIRLLDDHDTEIASRAAIFLGSTEAQEALPVLLEQMRSNPSPDVRAGCAMAVESFDDGCPLEPLVAALGDPEATVVAAVASALAWRGDPAAIEPLMQLLEHPTWNVRYAVSGALVRLGAREERLTHALTELLRTAEQRGRFQSLDWIQDALETQGNPVQEGNSGSPEEPDAEALAKAEQDLRDADPDRRRRAAWHLYRVGGPRATAALIAALDDPAPAVRSTAALALGTWEVHEALPGLTRHLLHDEVHHVRRMCAAFLHRFPAAEVIEPLLQALKDPDGGVRLAACVDLGLLGDPRAVPELTRLLDDADWHLRANVCRALVELRSADPRLVKALEQLAQDPEAIEWDLSADEIDHLAERFPPEDGEPEAQPGRKIHQLLAEARTLAANVLPEGHQDGRNA